MRLSTIILLLSCLTSFSQGFSQSIAFKGAAAYRSYSNVLWDAFNVEAGQLATNRIADTVPYGWQVITNDGGFSITNEQYFAETNIFPGAQLKVAFQSSFVAGDLRIISTNAFNTNAGLCFLTKLRLFGNSGPQFGFERASKSGVIDGGAIVFANGTIQTYVNGNPFTSWPVVKFNQDYEFAVVVRKTGNWYFLRGGEWDATEPNNNGFYNWHLIDVDNTRTDSTIWPAMDFGGTANAVVDSVRVFQLRDTSWADPYNTSTDHLITSTNDTTLNMRRDAIVEHYITGATGVQQEMKFRIQNPSNYFVFRMDNTGSWSKLIFVSNAVESLISSNVQAFANGTRYRIQAYCYSSNITTRVDGGTRGSTVNAPAITNEWLTANASHAGTNFVCWSIRTNVDLQVPTARTILAFGDSKTFGGFDTVTPPSGALAGYQRMFLSSLNTNNTLNYTMLRTGHSGLGVSELSTNLVQYLNELPQDLNPLAITVNVGANNCATTIDSVFTNNYANILDSLHAKYPAAPVYVTKIFAKSCLQLTNVQSCATGLIAARSSWCFPGTDESVFLENGDNGATYMFDSTHPNHWGYQKTAEQWRAVLGL